MPSSVPATDAAPASLYSLRDVRLLESPFSRAVAADRQYLLALDPDRLLAPFRREAGLAPRKPSYGNWESMGLDGHTAGHYLSALADMIASGSDTRDGLLKKRLDSMIDELAECQNALGTGYLGGVPGSADLWKKVAQGHVEAVWEKWVPWYNLHKTFAGLRDAWIETGSVKARDILIKCADWAERETSGLTDSQMQAMLGQEHGGMNEVLADVYAITKDPRHLALARRFSHQAILEPLEKGEDRLTGLHANTQIPKVIGFARIASLTGDAEEDKAARFFWETVTRTRTVAFGGNSVSEHFNDPKDFNRVVEHREGPETCNTYNMLRLTEQLFPSQPRAEYADYYERALYNHILASINQQHPGFVYFTPLRPGHYRVYSQPSECFWCCVGTGMENPGRYGQFIYARAKDGVYVSLFIPSELTDASRGLRLRQETAFPDREKTSLTLRLKASTRFTLHIRHPRWVSGPLVIRVNGRRVKAESQPSSYASLNRLWRDGDRVEVSLPMQTEIEGLPDGSSWHAILRGPILLACPTGTQDQAGLIAGPGRGDHIAHGPLVALDKMPALAVAPKDLASHVVRDPKGGPLAFRLMDVSVPKSEKGLPLVPFYRLQETRYQMYWQAVTREELEERRARLAEEEKAKLARDAATLDSVAPGEQQSETDHQMTGEAMESGLYDGRRWRHGRVIQYVLDTHGAADIDLAVTYSGTDQGRVFTIHAGSTLLASQALEGRHPGSFFEVRYPIPPEALKGLMEGRVVIRFTAQTWLAGGLYDVRLLKRGPASP